MALDWVSVGSSYIQIHVTKTAIPGVRVRVGYNIGPEKSSVWAGVQLYFRSHAEEGVDENVRSDAVFIITHFNVLSNSRRAFGNKIRMNLAHQTCRIS